MARRQRSSGQGRGGRIVFGLVVVVIAFAVLGFIGSKAYAGGIPGVWTSPAQKQAALAHAAAQQTQAANEHKTTAKTPVPTVASCPDAAVTPTVNPPGLGGSQFNKMYVINTAVTTPTEPTPYEYSIAGGSDLSNTQQGMIGVSQLPKDPCAPGHPSSDIAYYPTPTQDGAVTLTQAQGDLVLFTTANGQQGSFNYMTEQFS